MTIHNFYIVQFSENVLIIKIFTKNLEKLSVLGIQRPRLEGIQDSLRMKENALFQGEIICHALFQGEIIVTLTNVIV